MKEKDMWKNRTDFCRGSFTVEASFILPFICFLLAVLLQTILYLHDTSVFASAAYEAAQKAAELKDTKTKERAAFAREQALMLLEKKRLACKELEVEAWASTGKVQVCIRGYTGFFGGISLEAKKEVLYTNPVEYLRNIKKAKNLWNKITDG